MTSHPELTGVRALAGLIVVLTVALLVLLVPSTAATESDSESRLPRPAPLDDPRWLDLLPQLTLPLEKPAERASAALRSAGSEHPAYFDARMSGETPPTLDSPVVAEPAPGLIETLQVSPVTVSSVIPTVQESAHPASSQEGPAHDGQVHDGLAQDGQAHEGQAHEGQAHEGQAHEGQAHEGLAHDGLAHEGSARHHGPRLVPTPASGDDTASMIGITARIPMEAEATEDAALINVIDVTEPRPIAQTPEHLEPQVTVVDFTEALDYDEFIETSGYDVFSEALNYRWHVQLLAGRSLERVKEDQRLFIHYYGDLLQGLNLTISQSRYGDARDEFYRLRAVEWANRQAAINWCDQLQARGHQCLVTRIVRRVN